MNNNSITALSKEIAQFHDKYIGGKTYAEIRFQTPQTQRWIETITNSPQLNEETDLTHPAFVRQAPSGPYVETTYFVKGNGREFEIQRAQLGGNFLVVDITGL